LGERGKEERRIRQARRSVRLEDLLALLRSEGFACDRGGEGHWLCSHRSGAWCNIAPPHGPGDTHVRPTYVSQALKALDAAREWAAEQDDERDE
jgi:hypothetical protein